MRGPDLSVGAWLAVGLGAAAAVLLTVSGAAVLGLRGIDAELRRQREVIQPRAEAAIDLQVAVLRLGIAARAQTLAPSPARGAALAVAEHDVDRISATLEAFQRGPEDAALFAAVPPLVRAYRARAHELATASPASVPAAEARLRGVREELLPHLDAYVSRQHRRVDEGAAAVLARHHRANLLLGTGVAAALALLAAVGLLVSRAVRRPVEELVALTRRVGEGDYAAAAALPPAPAGRPRPRSELAELGAAFGAMARALEERDRRIAAQGAQLQAQNEELQAQNEELQAQAEEIQSQGEELQAQNEELRASEEALRDADRRKDEFLAVLSHELRNPLAPIVNGLAILAEAAPASAQAERARAIVGRQVRQLTRIVDDLLDVTRIARGKTELRRREVDLAAVVRHVAEDHRALFEGAGVRLEVDVPTGPIAAWADPERLSQVVANLVQNAAKFTPAGGTVRVSCAAGHGGATLCVRDDGEGIPPDLLGRLFEPFVQADGSLARTRGGLGLGLALVKGIVDLHGGRVHAASDGPGRGAVFTVELPLGPPPGVVVPVPREETCSESSAPLEPSPS